MDVHKAVALFEVTDMEAFKEIFTKPKAADFHFKHNLVDTFYTLEKLSWLTLIDIGSLIDGRAIGSCSRLFNSKASGFSLVLSLMVAEHDLYGLQELPPTDCE